MPAWKVAWDPVKGVRCTRRERREGRDFLEVCFAFLVSDEKINEKMKMLLVGLVESHEMVGNVLCLCFCYLGPFYATWRFVLLRYLLRFGPCSLNYVCFGKLHRSYWKFQTTLRWFFL